MAARGGWNPQAQEKMAKILPCGITELVILLVCMSLCSLGTTEAHPLSESNTAPGFTSASVEDTCGIENYQEIKEQLLEHYDVFDSFYRLSRFAETSTLPRQQIFRDTAYQLQASACRVPRPREVGLSGFDPCPGVWVLTRDTNRVPCVQQEYRCQCNNCRLPSGMTSPGSRPSCQPTYNYVPVMRKMRAGGQDRWTYALEPLVVACTCQMQAMSVPR